MLMHFVVGTFSVSLMAFGLGMASGQDYPNKPVRIVTSGVGGGSDFIARQVAQGIADRLGQPVIVDNRGSGVAPGEAVAQAPADGYAILVGSNSLWTGPLLQKTSYDPVRDFSPISMTTRAPLFVVVHPSLPVKSVKDLIALAKAKPGQLNYSTGSIGASTHLAAELFKSMAGVNIVRVSYKTAAMQATDLISGYVQLHFGSGGTVAAHVKSGKLRAVAITSASPSALAPDLPTVAGSGVPGYEFVALDGIFAPAKTPEIIIKRLNQEIVRFLNLAETKERFLKSGIEAASSSPEQFAAAIKSEIVRLGRVIKDAGIKLE